MNISDFVNWANHNITDEARTYFYSRGASDEQIEEYKLGFVVDKYVANVDQDPNHSRACFDSENLNRCDSCKYNNWSFDRETKEVGVRIIGSIVLPITDYMGNFVGFQTRSLKEKNYDNFVVSRRSLAYFFGLGPSMNQIWTKKEILIVEGPFNLFPFSKLNIPTVSLMTSSVNQAQKLFLERFVRKVYLCLDNDEAGRASVKKFIDQNADKFEIIDMKMPKLKDKNEKALKDPGEVWETVGDEKFVKYFGKYL